MFLIVAHHYVCNSGLLEIIGTAPFTSTSITMFIFGAWGKVGINCFVLITGYFMCKSKITWRKLGKLYLQIIFYSIAIYSIFCILGDNSFRLQSLISCLFPFKGVAKNFVSCFLIFYLLIPFLNLFLQHLNKRLHTYLILLLVSIHSIIPSVPTMEHTFNYVEWFVTLYFIAAWIRNYSSTLRISHRQWGILSLISLLLSCLSIIVLCYYIKDKNMEPLKVWLMVFDCNKILALTTSVTTFMWFKDLQIKNYSWINTVGATTFGILLIHANSSSIMKFIWVDTFDVVGHLNESWLTSLAYAVAISLIVFLACSFIDWLRIKFIEERLLNVFENIFNKLFKNTKISALLD